MLFLSNMTPKEFLCWLVVLRGPSLCLRTSKNEKWRFFWECWKVPKWAIFGHFLKMDFELHICCHGNDLSDITNWQHIGGGPSGRNFCRNFCLPRPGTLNFHLWRRFFSGFDKINNFWQQKQLLLFLSNTTPKVLLT